MSDNAPPYETPAINEAVRVFDMTSWQQTVPAVYLGYEHVSEDFFMHRVRSDKGVESMLASHEVFRRQEPADGVEWIPLTKRPRAR
jgi:hypothetical protein